MKKSRRQKKSGNWVERQNSDQFVKKARAGGFRARAIFKLEQIDQKFRLIMPNTRLVDLGSAPGSWSQYAISRVQNPNQVVAVDLLPMEQISGVPFIQGDFTESKTIEQVFNALNGSMVDLVLSDMAPNITGIRATDQARAEALQESILFFCSQALKPGGTLLTKLFEGEAAVFMRHQMKTLFSQYQAIKPDASRSQSKEIFLLARGYKGVNAEAD
jgi:23S rRNA (uridine2552-2'-O)-methyltransferase